MKYDERHGGPWDRGSADSYYGRPRRPHYYVEGTGTSRRVEQELMTEFEVAAYMAGYNHNELNGFKKEWE